MDAKIALVTGGGSGIGRATALALADAGFAVVVAGRRLEALEETVALARPGQTLAAFACDVTDEASVDALFAQIEARFGRLDLLFNNAGTGARATPIQDLPLEVWRAVLDVNVTGSFLCSRAAVRLMRRQQPRGGRIVNNGSVSAHVPRPNSAPYSTSKHAITGLTKSLSLDGRDDDILCGQIDIGNAATALLSNLTRGPAGADGMPQPEPMMPVENAAAAVVFMASLPPEANVQFLTVTAAKMKFIGRG